jgi:hypothetical protein
VHEILGDTLPLYSEQFIIPCEEQLLMCEPDVTPMLRSDKSSSFVASIKEIQVTLEYYGTNRYVKR